MSLHIHIWRSFNYEMWYLIYNSVIRNTSLRQTNVWAIFLALKIWKVGDFFVPVCSQVALVMRLSQNCTGSNTRVLSHLKHNCLLIWKATLNRRKPFLFNRFLTIFFEMWSVPLCFPWRGGQHMRILTEQKIHQAYCVSLPDEKTNSAT